MKNGGGFRLFKIFVRLDGELRREVHTKSVGETEGISPERDAPKSEARREGAKRGKAGLKALRESPKAMP